MFTKEITYEDYFGTERTETFYFNYTKLELAKMKLTEDGDMKTRLEKVVNAKNDKEMYNIVNSLVLGAYGVPSADGRKFVKNDEVIDDFVSSPAYEEFYLWLAEDSNNIVSFILGTLPKEYSKVLSEELSKNPDLLKGIKA